MPRPPLLRADEVSVVIPAFNHERFVGSALESLADQSLGAGDVVAVDDGSSDDTPGILESFPLSGLTVVRQSNQGAHAALNRAISLCRGSWIAILDSDDLFAPERLEHALGIARSAGAALLLGRVRLVDETGAPLDAGHPTARWYREALGRAWRGARAASLRGALREHNVAVTTSNFFFHRELWRRVGGFRRYRYVHDLDFLLRALDLCPDQVLFEETIEDVFYRVHSGNTIREDVEAALAERREVLRADGRPIRRAARAAGWRPGSGAVRKAVATRALPLPAAPQPEVAASGASLPVRCGVVVTDLHDGGLEEVVSLLALLLPKHGMEPFVLCTSGGGDAAARLSHAGVPVAVADGRPAEWRRWMARVRPQVLSTHFVDLRFLEEVASFGVPAIETVHNMYAWFEPEDWMREAAKSERLWGTIAVSRMASDYYARHLPNARPSLAVIPNGIGSSRVCAVPRSHARIVLGIAPNDRMLVQVGRLSLQKNQAGLVSAFREVLESAPDALLVLVGAEPDDRYAGELRARSSDLLAGGRLRILPPTGSVDVILSAADAFVADSFYEGWSLAAAEALRCGLPLLLSDCGGSRDLVGPSGERGYVVPNPAGDPLALTPERLRDPNPADVEGNREILARRMFQVVDGEFASETWREESRAHAGTRLTAEKMVNGHARVLRAASLGEATPGGALAMDIG